MTIRSVSALRGNRDFRLIWVGQFTSELGSSVVYVATPLIALAVTGSATEAGLLGTIAFLTAWLGSVPMGHVADRYAPRRLMLACDGVRLVASAVLAAGVATGFLSLWWLIGCVIVTTLATLGFRPAATKMMRAVVPDEQLGTAVAANQLRGQTAALVGPALGGVLLHLGRTVPFVADTISFAVSLWCVGATRTVSAPPAPAAPATSTGQRRLFAGLGQGFSPLWHSPFLRALAGYATLANLAVSILTFTIILGPGAAAGGAVLGTALSVGAFAAMAGTMLAPRLHRRLGLRALLLLISGIRVVATVGAAILGGPVAAIVVLATVMLLQPVAGVAAETVRILMIPQELYGRVSGALAFVTTALQPAAPLVAGALVQAGGAAWAFGVVAVLLAAAGLVVAASGSALTVPSYLLERKVTVE